jgi:uncharacterized protein YchJ
MKWPTKDSKVADKNKNNAHVHGPDCDHDHAHTEALQPIVNTTAKVGRNELCSCGSQKKFKKCCANK